MVAFLCQVWERDVHVLTLVSDDDSQMNPSVADTYYNMYPEDRRHLMEVIHYPGAGHLLEPPYTPHCRFCYSPFFGKEGRDLKKKLFTIVLSQLSFSHGKFRLPSVGKPAVTELHYPI